MDRRPTIEEVIDRLRLFDGRQATWSTLSGGHMNEIFLVEAEGERYVVRVPDPSGGELIPDRRNERHNTIAAARAGVTPRVLEVIGWSLWAAAQAAFSSLDVDYLAIASEYRDAAVTSIDSEGFLRALHLVSEAT